MSLLQNRKFVFIVLNADKLKMKFVVWVLCIVLEISLLDYASSSSCQTLDRTLFTDCVQAGYNVSKFNPSRSPKELGLIASMQSKFKNCSSLSSLLTCSVQLSKCPTSTLPCKDVCKNFVSECQNSSSENDGLIALFRGICELLPSDKCSPKPNNVNNSASGKWRMFFPKFIIGWIRAQSICIVTVARWQNGTSLVETEIMYSLSTIKFAITTCNKAISPLPYNVEHPLCYANALNTRKVIWLTDSINRTSDVVAA